jgi:hypothetical protein
MRLLAVCPTCGLVPSGYEVTNSTDISISGNVDKCPKCGLTTSIPDGVYTVLEETVNVLLTSQRSVAEVKTLLAKVKAAKTADEATHAIRKAAPEIEPLIEKLPTAEGNGHKWIASVGMLLSLALSLMQYQSGRDALTSQQFNDELDRVSAKIVEQCRVRAEPAPRNRHERRGAKRHQ